MSSVSSEWWRSCSAVYLVLTAIAFAVYGNSLSNSFHYDDAHSILQNPHIRSLDRVWGFFVNSETFSGERTMGMYRPLTQATLALNYAAGKYSPPGYHLVNVLLHLLCACVVFQLIRALCGSFAGGALAALLFAVHPIHSQAVNYISARAEILAGLGSLLALVFVIRRASTSSAAIPFGLALLAKSTASVALPIVMLWEWSRPRWLRQWRRVVPFAILSIVFVIGISFEGFLPRSLAQDVRPMDTQIGTQLKALPYYLKLLAMPVSLSVEHEFREAKGGVEGAAVGGFLLLISLLIGISRIRRWAPRLGFGVGWFLAALSLTFVIPLNVLVSEHRLYVASVGILIAFAVLFSDSQGNVRPHTPLFFAIVIATLLLAALTVQRNRIWQSELTLWQDAVGKAPMMFRAQSNLALALFEEGDLERARRGFELAIELNPRYSKTWSNLGLVYGRLGRIDEAQHALERALELRPGQPGTLNNLGRFHVENGSVERGKGYLLRAVEENPWNPEARVNLGKVYHSQGDPLKARVEFEAAIDIDGDFAPAYNNLGLLYWESGEFQDAHRFLTKANNLSRGEPATQINLMLLESARSGVSKDLAYERALARYPQNGELWRALAEDAMRRKQWDEATNAYETLLEFEPAAPGD